MQTRSLKELLTKEKHLETIIYCNKLAIVSANEPNKQNLKLCPGPPSQAARIQDYKTFNGVGDIW